MILVPAITFESLASGDSSVSYKIFLLMDVQLLTALSIIL